MSLITWTQVFLIILFSLFAYLILKKKMYFLISGFATRAEEEQEALIRNGHPQFAGRMFAVLAAGMAVLQLLAFTGFSYTFELQIGFMFLVLFGGMILQAKKDIPSKRRRALITSSTITAVVLVGVGILLFFGMRQPDVTFGDDSVDISGMYGREISYRDIRSAELLDHMPEITYKENGFGFSSSAKGWFRTEDYGSALLFVDLRKTPVLLVETTDGPVFLTGRMPEEVKGWQQGIEQKTDAPAQ